MYTLSNQNIISITVRVPTSQVKFSVDKLLQSNYISGTENAVQYDIFSSNYFVLRQ